jgi:hypothetical protein
MKTSRLAIFFFITNKSSEQTKTKKNNDNVIKKPQLYGIIEHESILQGV